MISRRQTTVAVSCSRAAIGAAALCALAGVARGQDLNGNFIPDSQEIRLGLMPDCNHNGFIDSRDVRVPHFEHAIEHLNGIQPFQNNVWDVCPLDFNGDGRMDLALAVFTGTNVGTIALWRNDGGPGLVFQSEITFNEQRPTILKSADLNGDQRPDLIAADSSFNQVYVLLATGSGTFAAPVILAGDPSNNGSVGLAVGDLDNDGDQDIACTSWGTNKVNIFLNNGNGTFAPRATYATDLQPRAVAIGDFTGDGFADLAIANQYYGSTTNGTVTLLRNNGNGTFAPHATLTMPSGGPPYTYQAHPFYVKLADIDHDGDQDLITSSTGSNVLSIHLNNGQGGFTPGQTLGGFWLESSAGDVLVKDLDGDGWPDIAWGDTDQHIAKIYRNNSGVFEFHQDFAAGNTGGLYLGAADYSGDGRPDLVVANDSSRTFSILVNKGGLDFAAPVHLRPDQYSNNPAMADFNRDGIADLAVVRTNPAGTQFTLCVALGRGNAVFSTTPMEMPLSSTSPGLMLARDINHDGKPDLLEVGGRCNVYLGNGDGTFAPPIASPIAPVALRTVTADLNHDGELDLAWIWPGHPSLLRVSLGDGAGHFGAYTEYTDVAEDQAIGVGDITGDGAPEIFTGHSLGILSVHTNNGDGTFGTRRDITITGSPANPAIGAIAVADFDGDNDNDVVVSASGLRMFFNPGNGNLLAAPITVNQTGASILAVADIDLDGDPDLYGRGTTGMVFLNNGAGTFDVTMFLQSYDSNARTMLVADANNDGRPDVMIGPESSWGQYLFLNRPSVAPDVNGNGIPDTCENLCYANCDGSAGTPVLNVNDFICFQGRFAARDPYADCDQSGALNINDFICFQSRFATGCR